MGCLKLAYQTTESTSLKVVYRAKNLVQRFNGEDLLASQFPQQSPFMAMDGNPIMKVDPTGLSATKYVDEEGVELVPETQDGSTDVVTITKDKEEGFLESYYGTQGELRWSSKMNNYWKEYSGNNIRAEKLDPSILNGNLFKQHYPGGNNPKTYHDSEGNRKDDYSVAPKNPAGIPAYIHDLEYDKLGAVGAGGLFFDTGTSGADFRFVKYEMAVALTSFHMNDYGTAAKAFGLGFGLISSFKTSFAMSSPIGRMNISINSDLSKLK
jgi:hypothetical protein